MNKKILSIAVITAIGAGYASLKANDTPVQQNFASAPPKYQDRLKPTHPASPHSAIRSVIKDDSQHTAAAKATTPRTDARLYFPQSGRLQRGDNLYITAKPLQPLYAVTADDAKSIILEGGKDFLHTRETDDLTLLTAKRDDLGNVFYKYSQTYNDLPVFGREVVVQINPQDEVTLIGGQYEPAIELDTTPQLAAKDAVYSAFSQFDPASTDTPTILAAPELLVYTDDDTQPVLAYKTPVEYVTNETGYHKEWLFVDANKGTVINRINMIYSAFNYSIHTLDNQCLSQNSSALPGTEITADDGEHAAGVDANSGHAYWFYQHMFGRDSWDNKGRKLVSTIHARFQGSNGSCGSDNAFFTGDQMVYGDGSTSLSNPGAAIDIFGHEFSHGFTASESNLTYQNESGAINESISDIMGTGVSIWKNSGGSSAGNPDSLNPTDKDWDMGEDAALQQSWQRHMDDPEENGQSIDDYNDRNTGTADSGGVHTNSGIMNLAFYLLSQGGTHPRGNTTNTVTAIGVEKALQVYYYANNNLFTSSTNFEDARAKLASAAKTLYGCDAWESVHQSYDAVNVPGTRSAECDTTDDGGTGGDTGGGAGGDTGGDTTPPATGNNIALNSATSASSTYSNSYAVQNATDGNSGSYWVSRNIYNSYTTEYVMMDLGNTQTFNTLAVNWGGSDAAGNIAVWVWNNNRWNLAGSQNGAPATDVQFSSQQARYVLLTMKNGLPRRWYAISEITIQ